MYIFKGPTVLETLDLFTRSCWLFGRERLVVDVPTEHPSCSKQHAVVQFRWVERKDGVSGERKGVVRPYLIDLESANGSRVNGERVPEGRYVELKTGDVVVFGDSTREYVVMLPPEAEG
jgi:smad nuclear-interacting protein 1